MGKLYVVGTPIGNLGDMTYRAIETLKNVDFICAEDTRVTLKLLNHFEIKKQLICYQEHNAAKAGEQILARLTGSEDAAIVTDAGMPCISDPGEKLVKLCAENGIKVEVVPGPSAVISALAISGLNTSRFRFEGFLSVNKRQRYDHLAQVRDAEETLIFYEAPHKLHKTLRDMLDYFGDRRISLCRELTKLHEEVIRTTLSQALEMYPDNKSAKGEFVLVIEGAAPEAAETADTIEQAYEQVRALVEKGVRGTDACREIAKSTGFPKGELYAMLVEENSRK
ncbi:16S rRNA (cytidine(1402)-2'-O)-methyltransferase [Ruminococcus albus]|uniref:Ribosomal RNA small subunit methyltransferase I n=1 Tax=Ruminococcus albus (strain ATCC 27210 / DSM 20455 / JCM 14654 / NCDO 2250 / 7) TaxID=697329 RepID=E6UF39_RUMA7|nr:Uroporphyrin-III C/tetrapyrrole (Corrin/Porphyrin) methyltransferase [Ruminococcus albus 7 = DSM 20455]